jgi:hypothetical protein
MSDFSEFMNLYSTEGIVDPREIKQVPVTELDDPLSAFHTKRAKGNVAAKIMENSFVDSITGPTPAPETLFPTGHAAIEQFNKMFHTEVDPKITLQLEAMKKSGRPGWFAYKEIEKASSLEEGLRNATELFIDKATPSEKVLLDKAIASLDLSGWLDIFRLVFAKA